RGFATDTYHNLLGQFSIDEGDVNAAAEREKSLAESAAIAAGATTSEGLRDDLRFIEGQQGRDIKRIGLQRDAAGITYRERLASLDHQTRSILLDAELDKLSNEE